MQLKYLTYIVLLFSILSLWIPSKIKFKPWQLFLGISLILAFFSHLASSIAIVAILLFYCLVAFYSNCFSKWKYILWIFIFALGLVLELHLVPGFYNLLILNKVQLTANALPYTLYLDLDKASVGLIILGLTLGLAKTRKEWQWLLKQMLYRLPLIILLILILSITFGYVRFEPKFPQSLWVWVISNLFFTCLAEEGLFRGFFQESLSRLKYKYSEYVAIFIPAVFFGAMHYPGGIKYVFLATVAGILYGWVYQVTRKIEASILAHFMLNLTHILFFTYPALMQ